MLLPISLMNINADAKRTGKNAKKRADHDRIAINNDLLGIIKTNQYIIGEYCC